MHEPPALAIDRIRRALGDGYGLHAATLTFLPVGNDATAWIFRVDAPDQQIYLLKLKVGMIDPPSLNIPAYLHSRALPQAVAPLPTRTQQLCHPCGDFTLILYPFIAGATGMARGLSDRQWSDFGRLLYTLHNTELPAHLRTQLRCENFVLPGADLIQVIEGMVRDDDLPGEQARALAHHWRQKQSEIRYIVTRTRTLGQLLQQQPPPPVLCHADIHTANLLVDPQGGLHVVDWDGVLLAPKERDLIFVMERATPRLTHERHFFAGYGATQVDPLAFAYYRYEWVVQELTDYGQRILLTPDGGAATKADALQSWCELFQPGDVVDVAYATEADLAPR